MTRHSITFILTLPIVLSACMGGMPEIRVKEASRAIGASDENALSKGRMLFARGEYALAIEAFRKSIRFAPGDASGYEGLATSYDQMGRFDLSGRYFELALAMAPRDPALLARYAQSLARQGRTAEARQLIAQAHSHDTPLALAVPADTAPEPVASRGLSITIPIEAVAVRPYIQLERLSLAEVALVTRNDVKVNNPHPVGVAGRAAIGHAVRIAIAPTPVPVAAAGEAVPPATTNLKILNAVGRRGQAARMRSYLAGQGWAHAATGDAPTRLAHSRLLVPSGYMGSARQLADKLPFRATLVPSRHVGRIVLVLGMNATPFDNRLKAVRS